MTRTSLAALAIALTTGLAYAQQPNADRTEAAHVAAGPAGTVGAMQSAVQGLATSPEDVAAQQEGRSTAADGGGRTAIPTPAAVTGYAPGTVGAAPGSDTPR